MACVIGGLLVTIPVAALQVKEPSHTDSSASVPKNNAYEFRHYVLNESSSMSAMNGTWFCFDSSDFPFDIKDVEFGDFRNDESFESTYYSGSGILLEASGTAEVLALKEFGGDQVSSVNYTGQPLVVFGGETTCTSYPGTTVYEGVDRMIQDWREGIWTPESGVVVEHSDDTVIADASFIVMVFVPTARQEIPEFDAPLVVGLITAMVLLAGRFRRKNL